MTGKVLGTVRNCNCSLGVAPSHILWLSRLMVKVVVKVVLCGCGNVSNSVGGKGGTRIVVKVVLIAEVVVLVFDSDDW